MSEQRRSKRFQLQLPLTIMRTGSEPVFQSSETRNISSGGILFTSENELRIGRPLEYLITLANTGGSTINLRCMGKVVRLEPVPPESDTPSRSYEIAATLERYEFQRSQETATG